MFDQVTAYHRQHGDDYGSEEARYIKYRVLVDGIRPDSHKSKTLLDVGCGEGHFKHFISYADPPVHIAKYTGIDLLTGENVLDHQIPYDIVIANGIFYKLGKWSGVKEIIAHMWTLTRETLAFNSLSTWAPHRNPDELFLDPIVLAQWCQTMTTKIILRHDYMPHDFTIFMYR